MEKKGRINGIMMSFGVLACVYALILFMHMNGNTKMLGPIIGWSCLGLGNIVFAIRWRKRKVLPALGAMMIVAGVLCSGIILIRGNSELSGKAEYAIVLGASLVDDQMQPSMRMRCEKAVEFANEYPDVRLIVTGGRSQGNTLSEAEAMRNYLVDKGIDADRIILEDESTGTYKSIENCSKLIDTDQPVVIISSRYHILRARILCGQYGLQSEGYPADSPLYYLPHALLMEEIKLIKDILQIRVG